MLLWTGSGSCKKYLWFIFHFVPIRIKNETRLSISELRFSLDLYLWMIGTKISYRLESRTCRCWRPSLASPSASSHSFHSSWPHCLYLSDLYSSQYSSTVSRTLAPTGHASKSYLVETTILRTTPARIPLEYFGYMILIGPSIIIMDDWDQKATLLPESPLASLGFSICK